MTENNIEIRDAVSEDSPEISRIWLEGLRISSGLPGPPEAVALTSFESRIREPLGKSAIWVAVAAGSIVGWSGLQDFGVTQTIKAAQSSTYIAEGWHSKGVGRKLLQYAMQKARERQFALVVGWVRTDNESSLALVKGLNWKFVGIMPRTEESEPELAYYAYAVPRGENVGATSTSGINRLSDGLL